MRTPRILPVLLATVLFAAPLAAEPPHPAAAVRFVVEMKATLLFEPRALTVATGNDVTIWVFNNDTMDHTFDIDEFDVHSGNMIPGQNWTTTFRADQSRIFIYYCAISGHRAAGMWGELRVGVTDQPPQDNTIAIVAVGVSVLAAAVFAIIVAARHNQKGGGRS